MKYSEMNGNQKIAFRNTKCAFDFIVGDWYNAMEDGYFEDLPETEQEAKDIVYDSAMNHMYSPGAVVSDRAPREMRFAGSAFVKHLIDVFFRRDSDVADISVEMGW